MLNPLPPHDYCASQQLRRGIFLTEQLGAGLSCRYLQEQDEAAARQRFERQASRLHHLVSTSAIPSIYASPYAVLTGSIPLVEGVPLEEHIRSLSKGLVRRIYSGGRRSGRLTKWVQPLAAMAAASRLLRTLLGAMQPMPSGQLSQKERMHSHGKQGSGIS